MSRVGRAPIKIPAGVKVELKEGNISVEGPLGKLERCMHPRVAVDLKDGEMLVKRLGETAVDKSFHGLYQRLINGMVIGVTKGYEKKLEIIGVGFRAKVEGKDLVLNLGFSHPVKLPIPGGLKAVVSENTKISVTGADKQLVGQFAADIRSYKSPEPYKGKGIRYVGEHVRRKAGKTVAGKTGAK